MSDDRAAVEHWWDQLSEAERMEALTAHRNGRATERLHQSLEDAGIPLADHERHSAMFPSDVDEFLKMRHDGL
jgi:hypothetical protein